MPADRYSQSPTDHRRIDTGFRQLLSTTKHIHERKKQESRGTRLSLWGPHTAVVQDGLRARVCSGMCDCSGDLLFAACTLSECVLDPAYIATHHTLNTPATARYGRLKGYPFHGFPVVRPPPHSSFVAVPGYPVMGTGYTGTHTLPDIQAVAGTPPLPDRHLFTPFQYDRLQCFRWTLGPRSRSMLAPCQVVSELAMLGSVHSQTEWMWESQGMATR